MSVYNQDPGERVRVSAKLGFGFVQRERKCPGPVTNQNGATCWKPTECGRANGHQCSGNEGSRVRIELGLGTRHRER